MEALRRDFTAGVLVFVPIVCTVIGAFWIIERLDNLVLPKLFAALGMPQEQPPFLGVIVTLLAIIIVGFLTRSFIGRAAISLWESMIDRVPVARSLYSVLKQFMQAVVGDGEMGSFSRVVLLEYPRRGIWCYGFVTGTLKRDIPGLPKNLVKVFIPSTPNPTTGYYLLVPTEDVRESGLSVDDAFRVIVSAGIAQPTELPTNPEVERAALERGDAGESTGEPEEKAAIPAAMREA